MSPQKLVLLAAFLLSGATSTGAAPSGAGVALQAQSKATLGVNLRALVFLFQAEPGIFNLKEALVEDGSWLRLKELEAAGFVTVVERESSQGLLVEIALTQSGTQLRAEILNSES